MASSTGRRSKKYAVPERLEKEALSEADMSQVVPVIEEKFKNFPPVQDTEKEKEILASQTDNDSEEEIFSGRGNKSSLPSYLQNMPDGSNKSKQIIAAAQAAIILGTSPQQVAMQYGINFSKVVAWKNTLITTGAIGRRDRLSEMLMAHIEQEMKSLMAISIVTSEEEWIMRQDAGELAHFIAVKTDRLLMLLQAFGRVDSSKEEYRQQLEVMSDNG